MKNNCIILLWLFCLLSPGACLFAQVCTAKILQNDTTVCPGSALKLTVSINDSSDFCSTYSLSTSLQSGLLGWYPFCGNTNDISLSGNNGFPTGPLTYTTDRYNNPNTAINFSGNGESVRTNKIDRTTTNSFSYIVWVNTQNTVVMPAETIDPSSGFSIDLATPCVIHPTHGYNWNLNNQHTGAGLYVASNGVFVVEHASSIVATPLAWSGSLNGWHSVAIVYDNHLPKLYVDGQFIKNGLITPYTTHPSMACDSVYLNGTYPYLNTGFGKGFNPTTITVPFNNFNGVIDDIKIYSRALSQNEISELYAKDKSSILWSTGDTTHSITVTPLRDTVYSVTVTNSSGSCNDLVNISVKPCELLACEQAGIINNDTIVCSGAPIHLTAKNALSYKWYPRKGMDDSTSQNPNALIDTSITYHLTSEVVSGNLVGNGDFEQGNSGFFTNYINCTTNNCLYPLASNGYSVGTDASFFHDLFQGKDHTSGNGNFMIINGADPSLTVWRETINVIPNTDYAFGVWISTMIIRNTAKIRFSINGVQLGAIFDAPQELNKWVRVFTTWNSGNNTSAIIEIVDTYNQPDGNDFGLDDIFFGQIVSCTDSIHITTFSVNKNTINKSICKGQNYSLPSGNVVSASGVYRDTLQNRQGCDSLITILTLDVISAVIKNISTSVCEGQSYTLPWGTVVTSPGNYSDTLKGIIGCDSLITKIILSVTKPLLVNMNAAICAGQSYTLPSGLVVTAAGVHKDTLRTSAGCDSLVTTITLKIIEPVFKNIAVSICEGQSYTLPSGLVVRTGGTYKDTLKSIAGCDSIVTTMLAFYPPLSARLDGPSNVCKGIPALYTATASGGNGGPYYYTWSEPGGNSNQLIIHPATDTKLLINIEDGCTVLPAVDSLIIHIYPQPIAEFSVLSKNSCLPVTAEFTNLTASAAGNSYTWAFGDNTFSDQISPTHIYAAAGSYDVSLTTTNTEGCSDSVKITDAVIVSEKPSAGFTMSPFPNPVSNSRIEFTNVSLGAASWAWKFGDGIGSSAEQDPVYIYKDTGLYTVTLVVSSSNSCTDTAYARIDISGSKKIYIPNAFSPNGDGLNDNFEVYGLGLQAIDMTIYDRWGEIVFKRTEFSPSWNGKNQKNGKDCQPDVFVYVIKTFDINGKINLYKGTVLLIR